MTRREFRSTCSLLLAACVALLPAFAAAEPPLPDRSDRRADAGGSPPAYSRSPAAPTAARSPSLGGEPGNFDWSAILSLDIPTNDFRVGPRFTGEMMYGVADISPQLRFSAGLRGSLTYHTALSFPGSLWILEAVPDAKLRWALTDKLGVFGDFGLGLAFRHTSRSSPTPGASFTDDTVNLAVEFGVGASYALTDWLSLFTEFRMNVYTSGAYIGGQNYNPVSIAFPSVGVTFR